MYVCMYVCTHEQETCGDVDSSAPLNNDVSICVTGKTLSRKDAYTSGDSSLYVCMYVFTGKYTVTVIYTVPPYVMAHMCVGVYEHIGREIHHLHLLQGILAHSTAKRKQKDILIVHRIGTHYYNDYYMYRRWVHIVHYLTNQRSVATSIYYRF